MIAGGYGIIPHGQSEYGNTKSDIEPRFEKSNPVDGQIEVIRDKWLRYTVYAYSSWVALEDINIWISEDGGFSYNVVFDGVNFHAPYDAAGTKVYRSDGHRITFFIVKDDLWPYYQLIEVKTTAPDNFEQETTKNSPIFWE